MTTLAPCLTKASPSLGIPLAAHQRLCGGLFGDGSLDLTRDPHTGVPRSARYRENQGLIHWDWVRDQQAGLGPLTAAIKAPSPRVDARGYTLVEARTSRRADLLIYAQAFYTYRWVGSNGPNGPVLAKAYGAEPSGAKPPGPGSLGRGWRGTKGIPANSGDLLDNPLSLAAWVAGDGRPKANGDFTLCTQGYTLAENAVLAEILHQTFGVRATVRLYSNGTRRYPELYLPRGEGSKLLAHCDRHIANLPSLRHRFALAHRLWDQNRSDAGSNPARPN